MTEFTPLSALLGGAMIGGGSALLLLLNGRIAGVSGIVSGAVEPRTSDRAWRIAFVAGLLLGGASWFLLHPDGEGIRVTSSYPLLIVGGLLVGFGTRLGSGCTSGHGVCGLSRLSPRSVVATLVFLVTAIVTVTLVRHGIMR